MRTRVLASIAALVAVLLALAACGEDTTGPDGPPHVDGVVVIPDSLQMPVGAQETLSVEVRTFGTSDTTVFWQSTNTAVATVNGAGVVTAIAPGEARIIATSSFDSTTSGSSRVEVVE